MDGQKYDDHIEELLRKDGFHMQPSGRSGTIFYVDKRRLLGIYFEISGVSKYDLLIFWNDNMMWTIPEGERVNGAELPVIKERLRDWLRKEGIRGDLG